MHLEEQQLSVLYIKFVWLYQWDIWHDFSHKLSRIFAIYIAMSSRVLGNITPGNMLYWWFFTSSSSTDAVPFFDPLKKTDRVLLSSVGCCYTQTQPVLGFIESSCRPSRGSAPQALCVWLHVCRSWPIVCLFLPPNRASKQLHLRVGQHAFSSIRMDKVLITLEALCVLRFAEVSMKMSLLTLA